MQAAGRRLHAHLPARAVISAVLQAHLAADRAEDDERQVFSFSLEVGIREERDLVLEYEERRCEQDPDPPRSSARPSSCAATRTPRAEA
jgi:hypothetical protein